MANNVRNVVLAKMNAKESLILRRRYTIEKFPQLVLFIDGKAKRYTKNSLKTKDITNWLTKRMNMKNFETKSFTVDSNNFILINDSNIDEIKEQVDNLFIKFCKCFVN